MINYFFGPILLGMRISDHRLIELSILKSHDLGPMTVLAFRILLGKLNLHLWALSLCGLQGFILVLSSSLNAVISLSGISSGGISWLAAYRTLYSSRASFHESTSAESSQISAWDSFPLETIFLEFVRSFLRML